jgi:1-acyl-sn-glycerol-3-phosphate acyltransferase
MDLEDAHRKARERGVSNFHYELLRTVLLPLLSIFFELRIEGRKNIPRKGAAIIVPNHKSFFDSFFIVLATRRPIRFMGMDKHFRGRWGPLFLRLGAFPVRKGESDEDSIRTALHILERGELLAVFPEGVSVRNSKVLGKPHRGAARLALESGAPIIPCAITGTERRRLGLIPKPRQVRIAFSAPIIVEHLEEATPERAAGVLQNKVWPEVERQFAHLRAHRGLVATGLVGLGVILWRRQKKR